MLTFKAKKDSPGFTRGRKYPTHSTSGGYLNVLDDNGEPRAIMSDWQAKWSKDHFPFAIGSFRVIVTLAFYTFLALC